MKIQVWLCVFGQLLILPIFAWGDNICDFNILLDKEVYSDGEKVSMRFSENATPIVWVEDLFGNVVRQAYTSTEWTPRIGGRLNAYIIKAKSVNCRHAQTRLIGVINRTYIEQNKTVEKSLLDTGMKSNSSSITIESVKVTGQLAEVRINAYRGNTAKYSIQLYAASGGKRTPIQKLNLPAKFSGAVMTVSLPLDFCGESVVIASGLDANSSYEIDIPCRNDSKRTKFIKSFYTHAKLYRENITLYASLEPCEGCTLLLDSAEESITQDAVPGKNSINAMMRPGKNIMLLSLLRDKVLLDKEVLVIDFPVQNKHIEKQEQTNKPIIAENLTTYQSFVVREPDTHNKKYETESRLIWIILAAALVPLSIIIYRHLKA